MLSHFLERKYSVAETQIIIIENPWFEATLQLHAINELIRGRFL